MYDSPITMVTSEVYRKWGERIDELVMHAVNEIGVDIDKDKLVAALTQDKERYEEAYQRGYDHAKNENKMKVLVEKSSDWFYHDIREYDGLEECLDDIFENWGDCRTRPEVVVYRPDPKIQTNEVVDR